MKAIIAEKPSVAREIAQILGAGNKHEGYLSGNGYCITWAFGHLVGLALPEDYGITGYREASLPILPQPFKLTVRKVKKDTGYVTDTHALIQLQVIRKVISECQSIIVATDAGREGELIFRYIYEYLGCNKPFERLWISSLTQKAIQKGLESLKPGSDFEGLYLSAMVRSRADWLIGINASQAFSIRALGNYSLGRVQTPVLAMVCKRYLEHKEFDITQYWQLELQHQKEYVDFKSRSVIKWDEKKSAAASLRSIERNGTATVSSIAVKSVTEQPPLLFDLTGLQKEANTAFGFSASQTLEIAQSLYEKRFITYPRTASRYITEDLWPELPSLIRGLAQRPSCKAAVGMVKWGQFSKRIVNELKVTDHHALLITDKVPSALTAKENAIYDLIALRLIEAISEPCHKEVTTVSLEVLHYDFSIKGSHIITPGWREIKGSFSDREEQELQSLPILKEGDEVKIKGAALLEKMTVPPSLYTEAGLLGAMENAGKEIADEQQRKSLQGIGLGTPATRASIIETLFLRDYMRKEKKYLIPTEKGLQLYHCVRDKQISDTAMTAQWELALQDIEHGKLSAGTFQKQIESYALTITHELLALEQLTEEIPSLPCPKCSKHTLRITQSLIKCPDISCGWQQFRKVCKIQLALAEIELLINEGKTSLIKGMQSASGKKFNAWLVLNENSSVSFVFERKK